MIKPFYFLLLGILSMLIPQAQAKERGLVAYWNFDEGEGDVAHDISGAKWYYNNGKIHNPSWKTGIKGKCLLFGKDSYVEIPHTPSLGLNNTFSFEVWVKPSTLKGFQPILAKGQISADYYPPHENEYSLCLQGKSIRCLTWTDAIPAGCLAQNTWPVQLKENEWNHVVTTGDGKIVKYYVNGIFYGVYPYSGLPSGTHPLYLGYSSLQKSRYIDPPFPSSWEDETFFSGCMDEIKIYNRALSAKEIRNHYAEMTGTADRQEKPYATQEKEPCRHIIGGLMKPDNITDATGAPAYRKNLSLFVHNTTGKAMEIGKVEVNGRNLEEVEKTDGEIAWHVVTPTVIPPDSYGEILIRYWDADTLHTDTIDLTMWDTQGNLLDKGNVRVKEQRSVKFQSIGFQENLSEICVYLQTDETLNIREIRCNGTRTKFRAEKTFAKHTINPVVLYPSTQIEEGTYLFIEVATDKGNNSVLTRVARPFFPISIYRCFRYPQPNTAQTQARYREMFGEYADGYLTYLRKPGEKMVMPEWLDDCCRHYFNTFLGEPSVFKQNKNIQSPEEIIQLLKERNLHLGSLHEISEQERAYEGLLYYGLADEPSGVESARKFIEKFNRIGKETPRIPASIVFCNLDSNPCDYTYADRTLYDCYPIGAYAGKAPTSMGRKVKELAELTAPKPVGCVIQAFRANPTIIKKREYGWCRFPFPEEERLMVYDAIANGAKEISYFTYTIEPWEPTEGVGTAAMLGIPEAVKLWDEIGRINLELATLGPLLARGCVVKQEKQGDIEISHIAVGLDTLILVLVNTGYTYTKTGLITMPISLNLQLQLPASFTPGTVFEFTDSLFPNIPFTHKQQSCILHIPDIKTVKILIVTADSTLKSALREKQKSLIGKGT